ncbi:MAG: hypothetical protein AAGG01_15425 [Planctomycetota bacterium]
MQTLKDNWIWIVAPIALFGLIVLGLLLFGSEGGAGDYNGYDIR